MIEQFQPPQYLLRAAAHDRHNLIGTEKTMLMNEPDDVIVGFREMHGSDRKRAFETGNADGFHLATLLEYEQGC